MSETADIVRELHPKGAVQAELAADLGYVLRAGALSSEL
jgi:hypothetical protein